MSVRITIMLDDALVEKMRGIQAKKIKSSVHSVSFSHVMNEVLAEGLKKYKS